MSNKYLEKIAKFGTTGAAAKLVSSPSSLAAKIAEKRMARMIADVGAMKGRTKTLPVKR
jgi:hypothetical protein